MSLFVFLGVIFLSTFILGYFLEKIRVPWLFAALIVGLAFSFFGYFGETAKSSEFKLLSDLGLYLLLFLIGFELNFREIKKLGGFIIKATFLIELLEMLLVGSFVHFAFGISWTISFIVALSFATVGEAILLPILDEFKITKTKLGQAILGIATFDDIFELFTIVFIIALVPVFSGSSAGFDLAHAAASLIIFLGLGIVIIFIHSLEKKLDLMKVPNIAAILPPLLAILFLFIGFGIGDFDLSVLGAVFAGLAAKNLLPAERVEEVEPQIKFITYGLFAPIFFFAVGLETNVKYLFGSFFLVLILIVLAKTAKVVGSFLVGRSEFGAKGSIFMGVSLGVRFSTSLVLLKILVDSQLISAKLYSIFIGTAIIFKFIIPFMLSYFVKKWGIGQGEEVKLLDKASD